MTRIQHFSEKKSQFRQKIVFNVARCPKIAFSHKFSKIGLRQRIWAKREDSGRACLHINVWAFRIYPINLFLIRMYSCFRRHSNVKLYNFYFALTLSLRSKPFSSQYFGPSVGNLGFCWQNPVLSKIFSFYYCEVEKNDPIYFFNIFIPVSYKN